ncbi:MAG: CheR family methyltransferase [Hormoscilla sp.]
MEQTAIETILRKKIGLDPKVMSASKISKAAHIRQEACGLPDLPTYLRHLQASSQELEALIENVIVPETWFFRNPEAFTFLSRYGKRKWYNANQVLRLLSVPCSTGEEPYSIAMCLMDAGLLEHQFRLDAVDISKRSLLKAKRAVYNQNSFRGKDLTFRERYFQQTPEGYQLSEMVSRTVNFRNGNILDPLFQGSVAPYHVILCRNLLIYFDRSARSRAMQVLDRLLTPGGLLFVGHAETGQIPSNRFVSVQHPGSFAYRKVEQTKLAGSQGFALETSFPLTPPVSSRPNPVQEKRPLTIDKGPLPKDNPQESWLETARKLADIGQLDEAANLCETYLKSNRTNPQAYLLLGEVLSAAGKKDRAEASFQKAIYLEPNYYEALVHLALLKENRGDIGGAAVIRQRIQRLLKSQQS